MKKIILWTMLLICLCFFPFALAACSSAPKEEDPEPIKMTAEDLWCEFKYNREVAKTAYKGKQVTITGTIAEPPTEFLQHPCILLENGEDTVPDGIFCMFPDDVDVYRFNTGETITVTGICSLAIHVAGDDTNPYISIEEAFVP